MRHVYRAAIALFLLMVTENTVLATDRVALLIGNSDYKLGGALRNAVNDVAAIADALDRAGFDSVTVVRDATQSEMVEALNQFSLLANHSNIALVYYSGHGFEAAGRNFLVPTDFSPTSASGLDAAAVSLDRVLRSMTGAKTLKLVILDACRANEFSPVLPGDRAHVGLAQVEPPEANTLIAFAAKAGSGALDGTGTGNNSPYAASLARRLIEPGLDVQLALRKVRDDVLTYTAGYQEPFAYGTLGGDLIPLSKQRPEFVFEPSPARPQGQGTQATIDDETAIRELLSVFSNDPRCQNHRYSDTSVMGKSLFEATANVLVRIRIQNAGHKATSKEENTSCGHGRYDFWPQQAAYLVVRETLRHYDTGWRLEQWEPGWLAADNSWHSAR